MGGLSTRWGGLPCRPAGPREVSRAIGGPADNPARFVGPGSWRLGSAPQSRDKGLSPWQSPGLIVSRMASRVNYARQAPLAYRSSRASRLPRGTIPLGMSAGLRVPIHVYFLQECKLLRWIHAPESDADGTGRAGKAGRALGRKVEGLELVRVGRKSGFSRSH